MIASLDARLEALLGQPVCSAKNLHGGCIAQVFDVRLQNGERRVVKIDDSPRPRLDIEGWMLGYLKQHSALPVPDVIHAGPGLLVMSHIEGESRFNRQAQAHAAELVATLHQVKGDMFGLERDTLIGSLHQPNPPTERWLDFFREHRILHMARLAVEERKLAATMLARLETFCERLDEWLAEPEYPALLHGDLWTTNILANGDRITGFLDPAVYYGHPEIELAFSTLFGTFSEPFFERYAEINPLEEDFFEIRRDLYNLYPLLVHVRLFGGSYAGSMDRTLKRIGI